MNKKNILFLLLLLFNGCDNSNAPDFFKSVGKEVSKTIYFDNLITLLNVKDAFDVYLVKDTIDYITITCGENLIDKIDAKLSDEHTIELTNENEFRIVRNYNGIPQAEVHYKTITNVYAYGSAKVVSKDTIDIERYVFTERVGELDVIVKSPQIIVNVWFGTGNYKVRGVCNDFYTEPRYSSIINAEELIVNNAHIDTYSSGNVYVNPQDSLIANIYWTGDIIYQGNPFVKLIEKQGKGKIINKQ
ncbi:MAG: DUF2807 domain-containing protein [Bacteroidales bacterium]|nr:DUF2807 domain-containing protein [Bacteroidales bacterium]